MKHKIRNVVFTSLVFLISGVNVALAKKCTDPAKQQNCPGGLQRMCNETSGKWGPCQVPSTPKQQ